MDCYSHLIEQSKNITGCTILIIWYKSCFVNFCAESIYTHTHTHTNMYLVVPVSVTWLPCKSTLQVTVKSSLSPSSHALAQVLSVLQTSQVLRLRAALPPFLCSPAPLQVFLVLVGGVMIHPVTTILNNCRFLSYHI